MINTAAGLVSAAREAAINGDYPRAIWLCEQALERDPQNLSARDLLPEWREYVSRDAVLAALDDGDDTLTKQLLDEHLKTHPSDHFMLGLRALRAETPEAALADLDRALAIQPDDAGNLISRGLALLTLGREDDAERDYNRAIELEPDRADAWTSRASFLLECRRIQEALSDIKQALRIEPDDGYTFSLLAHAAYLMGHFDKVLEHAARARANDYEAFALTLDEADSLVRLGRAQEALALLEPLTEEDVPYVSLLCGIALTELKRPQEALAHMDDLDDPSTEHICLAYRADCLLQLDRRDDVPNLLKQALDAAQEGHDSDIENGTYDLAWCHAFRALLSEQYGLGLDAAADRQRALALLREAVAIDPHNLRYAMPEHAFAPMRNELQAMAATLSDDPA